MSQSAWCRLYLLDAAKLYCISMVIRGVELEQFHNNTCFFCLLFFKHNTYLVILQNDEISWSFGKSNKLRHCIFQKICRNFMKWSRACFTNSDVNFLKLSRFFRIGLVQTCTTWPVQWPTIGQSRGFSINCKKLTSGKMRLSQVAHHYSFDLLFTLPKFSPKKVIHEFSIWNFEELKK